jgi:hypothetical protein
MVIGEEPAMIELRNNELIFSFPKVHPKARMRITFKRTLRIPDDGQSWPLPPGLGDFPLRHVDDFEDKIPASWLEHGGVMMPMYQAEATWLSFNSDYLADHETSWPFAIKIATGKRSAITGDSWVPGLSRDPQNYLVVPEQPWLDGYVVEKGFIRQFVAMPLGRGYTAEEQITGSSEAGGIQIEVRPMKLDAFMDRWPKVDRKPECFDLAMWDSDAIQCCCSVGMGLAPGGRMRQEVYEDPYDLQEWNSEESSRCFVHITNSVTWKEITGGNPPTEMPTARTYAHMGLPWFEYYDAEAKALAGAETLSTMKSVAELASSKGDSNIDDAGGVTQVVTKILKRKRQRRKVREGRF